MSDAERRLKTFIDKFDPRARTFIRAARKAVRSRLPGAFELAYDNYNFFVLGYGPTERPSDAIVSLASDANGTSLFFLQGARLPDPKKVLGGSGNQVRSMRLPTLELLDRPEVKALLEAAVAAARAPFPKGKGQLIIRSVSAKQRPRRKASVSQQGKKP